MARTEHYYDPAAPTANSITVAVTAFVLDDASRLLLIRRSDNDLWALPGGAQEIGEYIADTVVRETKEESGIVVRETKEESGIDVEVTGVVGVYTNPHHVVAFSDGEVRQQFSICFRARPTGGSPAVSDESTDVHWFARDELNELPIHPSMRLRIDHGYAHHSEPHIG